METDQHLAEITRQFSLQSAPFAAHRAHSAEQAFAVLRQLGQFRENQRVLDSGCGPGLVACHLAPQVREVIGIDLTPAMIDEARAAATRQRLTNARFERGNMAALPFADAEFDAAVTRYTFHHLEEPAAALREMVRVTRPGGRIVLLDAAPEAAKRARYDQFEKLRDPSHTSALTTEELLGLGESLRLGSATVLRFRLATDLDSLLAASFPEGHTGQQLKELIATDLERDAIGFQPWLENEKLWIGFPVTGMAWSKPDRI